MTHAQCTAQAHVSPESLHVVRSCFSNKWFLHSSQRAFAPGLPESVRPSASLRLIWNGEQYRCFLSREITTGVSARGTHRAHRARGLSRSLPTLLLSQSRAWRRPLLRSTPLQWSTLLRYRRGSYVLFWLSFPVSVFLVSVSRVTLSRVPQCWSADTAMIGKDCNFTLSRVWCVR